MRTMADVAATARDAQPTATPGRPPDRLAQLAEEIEDAERRVERAKLYLETAEQRLGELRLRTYEVDRARPAQLAPEVAERFGVTADRVRLNRRRQPYHTPFAVIELLAEFGLVAGDPDEAGVPMTRLARYDEGRSVIHALCLTGLRAQLDEVWTDIERVARDDFFHWVDLPDVRYPSDYYDIARALEAT